MFMVAGRRSQVAVCQGGSAGRAVAPVASAGTEGAAGDRRLCSEPLGGPRGDALHHEKGRGVIGCSAGQYCNKAFRDAAAELGLMQREDWSCQRRAHMGPRTPRPHALMTPFWP